MAIASNIPVWILTFHRPAALSRQVKLWGRAGHDVHVFSNYPKLQYEDNETYDLVKSVHFNSLSYEESNSWCARSWNSIFIKAFMGDANEAIFVQDDTDCSPMVPKIIEMAKENFDLIQGPAGDTFFYMKKNVLREIGWFDEIYSGCYCSDADYFRRCYLHYDKSKLSIDETHDWGIVNNPIGLRQEIRTDIGSKCIDVTYENQHHEIEKIVGSYNRVLQHSWNHWKNKWGYHIHDHKMDYPSEQKIHDHDWYPWFTTKYLKIEGVPKWIGY